MRLLDLFCGAGGAAMGYHQAGFDVVGVDINPQPNYPFEFIQADALGEIWAGFDAVHASPPCQAHSALRNAHPGREYPDLIPATRALVWAMNVPYVIENVVGAPLVNPVQLCGSAFGLELRRHRLFETSFPVLVPACAHYWQTGSFPTHARKDKAQYSPVVRIYGTGGGAGKDLDLWRRTMGVGWMQAKAEISQAIPPAYTNHIGGYLVAALTTQAVAA